MATASWQAAGARSGRVPDSEIEEALLALTHCVLEGGDLVLLGGPAGSGKSAVLTELERRLPPKVRPLRLSARSLSVDELAAQILEQLQLPAPDHPREVLRRHVERMQLEGSTLALIVDDGDRLPSDAVRWLLSLASEGPTRTPVVLATRRYVRCLRALAGSGSCVSLVRLGTPAFAPFPVDEEPEVVELEAASAPLPAPEPLTPFESPAPAFAPFPPGEEPEVVEIEVASAPLPAPEPLTPFESSAPAFAPLPPGEEWEVVELEVASAPLPAPEPSATLESPAEAPRQEPGPEAPWSEPLRSVEELLADLDPSQLSAARVEPVRAAPIPVRASPLDSISDRGSSPAPARVARPIGGAPPARHAPPRPESLPDRRSSLRLGIAAVGVVAALGLAFWLLSMSGGTRDWRPIAADDASDLAPAATRAAERSPAGEHAGGIPPSLGRADRGADAGGDVSAADVVVSDVRQAIALLAESDDARAHAAAKQLLVERGPDPVGYELLDELDGRRAASPTDAVQIITARARVRAALCAAWAHDPFGDVAARLGCPGAGPPNR